MDQTQLYHSGRLTDGWQLFGAHPATEGGIHGWWFNVWACLLYTSDAADEL